jgi:hypothetical protein
MSVADGVARWEADHKALLKMEIIKAIRSLATGKLQVIRKASRLLEIQERVIRDNASVLLHDFCGK